MEMKIWLSGNPAPIQKQVGKDVDVDEVRALLSEFVGR